MAVFHTVFVLLGFCLVYYGDGQLLSEYKNPYFHFPYGGPYMGFVTAFALPLKAPTPGDVFIAVNFEASYSLPENQTEFTFPPIIAASARQMLYNFFERKLESHGYPGKPCLLRAICEGAALSTEGTGLLGDIVHLILTPSSTLNTNLTQEYQAAERQAMKKGHCKKYRKTCKFSLMKAVTWVETMLSTSTLSNKQLFSLG